MAMAHDDVRIDSRRVIGTYSTSLEENYINDNTKRRFYLAPGNPFNLNYGEEFKYYTDEKGHLSGGRYRWMGDHRQDLIDNHILDTDQSRLEVDFVSHRGVLASILQMGGNKDLEIDLAVTLYKGTYHLRSSRDMFVPGSTGGPGRANPQDEDSRRQAASSKLLLQFVTSEDGLNQDEPTQDDHNPDEPAPIKGNEYFLALMMVNCGNHRLLLSGEIQAEKRITSHEQPPKLPDPENCLNVRSREKNTAIVPMKALLWWAPNVIAGIPEICCGLRNDKENTIKKIEIIKTDDLARSGYTQSRWDPGVCIRTMESLLSQIKQLVPEDDANSIKQAFLIIRPVEEGPGVNRTFEIRDRLTGDRFVEIDELQCIFGAMNEMR